MEKVTFAKKMREWVNAKSQNKNHNGYFTILFCYVYLVRKINKSWQLDTGSREE